MPEGLTLSGFRTEVEGATGLVTSLHGVVGCSRISAENRRETYSDLVITLVNLARDSAFLVDRSVALPSRGLDTTTLSDTARTLRVVGYPQGIFGQYGKDLTLSAPAVRELSQLLPPADLRLLLDRGSPDPRLPVLSLSGDIQRGYSGAPVLTDEGRVVGVANGGLRGGAVGIGWAIPIWELRDWKPARDVDLARLGGLDVGPLGGVDAGVSGRMPPIYLTDANDTAGRIYRLDDGDVSIAFTWTHGRIYSIAVSPNGTVFFSNHNDRDLYEIRDGRAVKIYTHTTYLRDVAVDQIGRIYFSESSGAGGDGMIYRIEGARAVPYFQVQLREVDGFWAGDFTFDPDGFLWLSSGNVVPANLYKVEDFTPERLFTSSGSIAGFAFIDRETILYADWRSRIYRLTVPDFHVSEAAAVGYIQWMGDVEPIRASGTLR